MSTEAVKWAIAEAPDDLGGNAMAVLLIMADLANRPCEYQVWLDRADLAARARVSVGTVGRHLSALEAAGLIRKRTGEDRVSRARNRPNRVVVWQLGVIPWVGSIHSTCADREAPNRAPCADSPRTSTSKKQPKGTTLAEDRKATARAIVSAWWDWHRERGVPRPMGNYHAHVAIVVNALEAGWEDRQIRRALARITGTLVTWKLEQELTGGGGRRSVRAEDGGTAGMSDDETGRVVAL